MDADLRGLRLAGLEIQGGASQVVVRRPAGTPVRASVSSGLSAMAMDDQQFGSIGGPSVLHTAGWTGGAGYHVEVTGGASNLVVTASPAV